MPPLAGNGDLAADLYGYSGSSLDTTCARRCLQAVVDARGNRTSTLYDARGLAYAEQDPLGAFTTTQFDPAGNRVLRLDARGWPTTYTLDALGRTVGQLYRDGTRVTQTYDANGRLRSTADVSGVTTYAYDLASRLVGVVNGIGKALTYTLTPVGDVRQLTDPDGNPTTYSWDRQRRLNDLRNVYTEKTTLSYNRLDWETRRVLANGASSERTYDAAGRLSVLANRNAGGQALSVYTATYDPAGNRTSVLELDGSRVTYLYDSSYQLAGEQRSGPGASAFTATYAYDALGNRLSKQDAGGTTAYQYDQANALTLIQPPNGQPTTLLYDANGNLTSENAGGQLTTYSWDAENRLLAVAGDQGTVTSVYSAEGLRQRKEAAGGTTCYVYDGTNVLLETDANLVTQASYVDAPGQWGLKFSLHRAGASAFYLPDHQGTNRQLLDAGQAVTDTLLTDAWGVEVARTGSTPNPFAAFGQWGYARDTASRLYVRARYLRVDLGRWASRDPVTRGQGVAALEADQASSSTCPAYAASPMYAGQRSDERARASIHGDRRRPVLPAPYQGPWYRPDPYPRHNVWLCCRLLGFSHCFISTHRCGAWGFRDRLEVPVLLIPWLGAYCSPGVVTNEDEYLEPVYPDQPWRAHIPGRPVPSQGYKCVLVSRDDPRYDKKVCDCIDRTRARPGWYCVGIYSYHCQSWAEECLGKWPDESMSDRPKLRDLRAL